jgi:hypothetical protein
MFDSLPDAARVWSFAAAAPLAPETCEALLADVRAFLPTWTSHGRPVPAEADILHDRILVVAAFLGDGENAGVSGCGIDSMQRAVDEAAERAGVSWLDSLAVLARDGEALLALSRGAFRHGVRQGHITPETLVYDATVETLGSLRQQGLLRPAAETWHARAFRLTPA